MNKGEMIRDFISKGLTNEQVLAKVDTTTNSIRWHRSKMTTATIPGPFTAKTQTVVYKRDTVGAALERFGLADEVRTALERLNASDRYDELASWNFVPNSKATGRYGLCRYGSKTIEVNSKLLSLPIDLRMTFFHECAHALDSMLNGRSSKHGSAWQYIMAIGFRLPSSRCGDHTAEASEALMQARAKKAVETWICNSCGSENPVMRKRKYPANLYKHTGCGGNYRVKGYAA